MGGAASSRTSSSGLQTTFLYGYWGLVAAQVLSYFPFAYLLC
jgi:ABC-type Fe3+ transport system permease subunit